MSSDTPLKRVVRFFAMLMTVLGIVVSSIGSNANVVFAAPVSIVVQAPPKAAPADPLAPEWHQGDPKVEQDCVPKTSAATYKVTPQSDYAGFYVVSTTGDPLEGTILPGETKSGTITIAWHGRNDPPSPVKWSVSFDVSCTVVPTATNTPTMTPTKTNTPTALPTATNTSTPTALPTSTPTKTPLPTMTNTPTTAPSVTASPTSMSSSITVTATVIATVTPMLPSATPLPTATQTKTPIPTPTEAPAPGLTPTPTDPPTATPTKTATLVATLTPAPSPTATETPKKPDPNEPSGDLVCAGKCANAKKGDVVKVSVDFWYDQQPGWSQDRTHAEKFIPQAPNVEAVLMKLSGVEILTKNTPEDGNAVIQVGSIISGQHVIKEIEFLVTNDSWSFEVHPREWKGGPIGDNIHSGWTIIGPCPQPVASATPGKVATRVPANKAGEVKSTPVPAMSILGAAPTQSFGAMELLEAIGFAIVLLFVARVTLPRVRFAKVASRRRR